MRWSMYLAILANLGSGSRNIGDSISGLKLVIVRPFNNIANINLAAAGQ